VHQVQAAHEAGRRQHVDELDVAGEPAHGLLRSILLSRPLSPLCPLSPSSSGTPGAACPPGLAGTALRRNIFSIRPVTTYPPTTLAAAKKAAMKARMKPTRLFAVTPMSRAPASTMPWIELVADISGVCRVAGTFPMTSMPTSSASMKMVRSVTRAVDTGVSLGELEQ